MHADRSSVGSWEWVDFPMERSRVASHPGFHRQFALLQTGKIMVATFGLLAAAGGGLAGLLVLAGRHPVRMYPECYIISTGVISWHGCS